MSTETINPKWLKPSMTVEQAARVCRQRNCYLKATFDNTMGVRLVAIRYPVADCRKGKS